MFYSQLLLSKKGRLGTIWIAAHCYSKLKKHQIQQTDISSSVDKIIEDEAPVVAQRILAYLLLGVVRIYSKKVEFLFDDCNDVLSKLYKFHTGKKSTRASSSVPGYTPRKRYLSVKRPKRFALDKFYPEFNENQDLVDGNIRSPEQLLFTAGQGAEGSTSTVPLKAKRLEQGGPSTSYTPPRDVLSPHYMEHELSTGPSRNMCSLTASPEVICQTSFSLEDRLEPMELDEAEEQMWEKSSTGVLNHEKVYESAVGPSRNMFTSTANPEVIRQTSFSLEDRLEPMELDDYESAVGPSRNMFTSTANPEVIRQTSFSLEDRLEPMELDDAEEQQMHDKSSTEVLNQDMPDDDSDHVAEGGTDILRLDVEGDEEVTGSVDEEQPVAAKQMTNVEIDTPKSKKQQGPEALPSISVNVTPDATIAEGGVVSNRHIATVQTPAPRESAKIFKKQKVVFDRESLMVENEEYEEWLNNPRDLFRKVTRNPPTETHLKAWRADKFRHIRESLLAPLIPSGIPDDLGSLENQGYNLEVRSPVACKDKEQAVEDTHMVPEDDTHMVPEDVPATPVSLTHLNSSRSHDNEAVAAELDCVEPMRSPETVEKASWTNEGVELDDDFHTVEVDSSSVNDQEKPGYSARTRMAETYLRKNFLVQKKRNDDEVLNLSQLVSGKTKKESARLFYEMMVLKSLDLIDVKQEGAYDDIHLSKTSNFVE